MTYFRLTPLLLAFTLVACVEQESSVANPAALTPFPTEEVSRYEVPEGVDPREAHMGFVEAEKATSEIVYRDRADMWEDVHARMSAYLASLPEESRYYVQAVAAPKVLKTHLLPGKVTPEKAAAAADYLDMMVATSSPDAELVLDVVERFESQWSPAYVRDVARQASTAAFASIAKRDNCVDCASPPAALPNPPDVSTSDDRTQSAADELRRIADR